MIKRSATKSQTEIDFEEWLCGIIDPIIKDVESLIPSELTDEQKTIKTYWAAFAQNTINLSGIMSHLPYQLTQVMMSFRLLQEMSADIFYLRNHKENIARLAKVETEVEALKVAKDFTLRKMSQIIYRTDIRENEVEEFRKDGTQERIERANAFLEGELGEGMTKNLRDINNLLNGYSHFNPAGVFLQRNLTANGYFEMYMKVLSFYPVWLYLVLISLSDLLGIGELDAEKCEKTAEGLYTRIQESSEWSVDFVPKK